MITLIEALNFRCLRYISQPLDRFHVLVGPNASGKTTFLDVVAFLGGLVSDGPEKAVTANFYDLVWGREGDRFELAVEARIPEDKRKRLRRQECDTIRYEVCVGLDPDTQELGILSEKALLKEARHAAARQRTLFPEQPEPPKTIMSTKRPRGWRTVVNKVTGGNDNYYSEVYEESGKGWAPAFKFGPRKSALGNLPPDETKFPVTTWLKNLLTDGLQQFILSSQAMQRPSPPGLVRAFKPDGSNLPWVVEDLRTNSPDSFNDWIHHLRTALPDIKDIHTVERPEDRHRYLVIDYQGGLQVPSWTASEGTLRLLALTLPAYIRGPSRIFLVEEPENGIHPRAVETACQSLSSVYHSQVLLATHSPVILSVVEADAVLCFAKTEDGATDIVRGDRHPKLKEWRGDPNLGVLFAGGVLG